MATLQGLFALLHCELGRLDRGRAVFERLTTQRFADLPDDAMWLGCVAAASGACELLGDRHRGDLLYRLLTPYADHIVSPPHFALGPVAQFLGRLATMLDRFDEAEAHFGHAERINTKMAAPIWAAQTRLEWAQMLMTRARPADAALASDLLRQVIDTAQHLDLCTLEGRAAALLDRS